MVYKRFIAARGSTLSDEQAQRYGGRIDALMEEHDGDVTPELVYQDAQSKESPLHDYFEWNNRAAAKAHRLSQARELLRFIHVVVKREDGTEEEIRAFHRVVIQRSDETADATYAGVARVLSEEELRAQIIGRALHELETWRKRYQQYSELAAVFTAIESVKATTSVP